MARVGAYIMLPALVLFITGIIGLGRCTIEFVLQISLFQQRLINKIKRDESRTVIRRSFYGGRTRDKYGIL